MSGLGRKLGSISAAFLCIAALAACSLWADVLYVSPDGGGAWPYATWADAAVDIQTAVDAAGPGDTVLVTNGTYQSGGKAIYGSATNRIAITGAVTVASVNGPQSTIIVGQGPVGEGAIRCAYVGSGASLIGFTLTNGHTRADGDYFLEQSGGGAWCEEGSVVSNCVIVGNSANYDGGGVFCFYGGTVDDCAISGNTAVTDCGGGVSCELGGLVQNSTISGNSAAVLGGGVSCAFDGTVYNCTIDGNSAGYDGGGVSCFFEGLVVDCVISNNVAEGGGGVDCTLDAFVAGCTIVGNNATLEGGGGVSCGSGGTIFDCTITGNSSEFDGGGAYAYYRGVIENCRIYGNWSSNYSGGGVALGYRGTVRNSSISENYAGMNGGGAWCFDGGILESCTVVSNVAAGYGGGVSIWTIYNPSAVRNTIMYYNDAGSGNENWHTDRSGAEYTYCCTTPEPAGTNNIVADPLLVDADNGDYRLTALSPCVDAGVNKGWMFDSTDMAGNPRIMNGIADIGAYERSFMLDLRIFLQGPYDVNTHSMTTLLRDGDGVPLTSPYAADVRTVEEIPSNCTDWVLVELREDTNTVAVFSRSAFLRNDGTVVSDNGSAGILLDVDPSASCYVVVKHRNHLTLMSAEPAVFTNEVVSLDFTADSGVWFEGVAGAVEVEAGILAMVAGDADGDGLVSDLDALIYNTQVGRSGCMRSDMDVNGVVDSNDIDTLWTANQGRSTPVPYGEVSLSPALEISPERRTVLAQDVVVFDVVGGTGEVFWAFVTNCSGGTVDSGALEYEAGVTSSCVDVLQTWDAENRLGRAYMNVISPLDITQSGKAIVIAGRKSASDPVWPTTDYLADLAYNALLYRGFSKENIRYLSPETHQDADGNGAIDDIDLQSTWANVFSTFRDWAPNSDKLFVYMVDHGGDSSGAGFFRLSETEVVTAVQLNGWLTTLQNSYGTEVTVVIDCCHSGSFIDEMAYVGPPQRIVVTSCAADEATYFVAGGFVSFSDAFFSGVILGMTIEASFLQALDAMGTYQNAWLDDDGNGVYERGVDGVNAAKVELGASHVAGKSIPQIGLVAGNQILEWDTAATLWADDIASFYPLDKVWCMIVPPEHDPDPDNPVADIVELELPYNEESGRYSLTYGGFSQEGTYKIVYYAQDIWGSVSLPMQSYVTQCGFDERVILVAAGETNAPDWSVVNQLGDEAYHAFRRRWFDNDTIYYMNSDPVQDLDGDGTNDIDALPTIAGIRFAITNWACSTNWGGPADKLTVYLIGDPGAVSNTFRMNGTESLAAGTLDSLLDVFQASNASANVVLEFDGSGGFLPELIPPQGAENKRICVASCAADETSCRDGNGLISFSHCFIGRVFLGQPIGDAFRESALFMRLVTAGEQVAALDDDGDGIYQSKKDGSLAEHTFIGAAFWTGDDIPEIGSVTPDTLGVPDTGVMTLWAAGVSDVDGISNVFCYVAAPDYDGESGLVQIDLAWNVLTMRHEAEYSDFAQNGYYVFTFFAQDNLGNMSAPVQCRIARADAYEVDDSQFQAADFKVGETQTHNVHCADDPDWVKFYITTNYSAYEIKTVQQGANVDTKLTLYYELPDGTLSNVFGQEVDYEPGGVGIGEHVLLSDAAPGMYYVRVRPHDTVAHGPETAYDLVIWSPVGAEGVLIVAAVDRLNLGSSPPGAVANVDGVEKAFNGATTVEYHGLAAGVHAVRVTVDPGYRPEEDPALPGQPANKDSYLYGNPKDVELTDDAWSVAVFQFVPYVKANGLLRDKWTRERIMDGELQFVAKNGVIAGCVYDGYPNNAVYESRWYSLNAGVFPTNVWLPCVDWDLTVIKGSHSNAVMKACITGLAPGDEIDLGTIEMYPVDDNANDISDDWEDTYFPSQPIDPDEDSDGDGHDNRREYWCGTDPTNDISVFEIDDFESGHSVTLAWQVSPGRTYQVVSTNDSTLSVPDSAWPVIAGPWEATNGQTHMEWTDPADDGHRFYRVKIVVP